MSDTSFPDRSDAGRFSGHGGQEAAPAGGAGSEQPAKPEPDILQAIINGAGNSHLVYLDRNFNFVHVNETYARTCGYRPEEMIGKNHFALYPHPENEAIFARVRDTGQPYAIHDKPFEFPDQPERGTTYWDWTLTPVKDASGEVVGLVFSLFETTGRKRLEHRYRRFADLTSDYVHYCTRTGSASFQVQWIDGAINPISGYSIADIQAQGCFLPLIHPDDRARVEAYFLGMAPGDRNAIEFRIVAKDGATRWVYEKSFCEASLANGELLLYGAVTDITELKNAQEQLKASEERFRSVMELSPDIISIITADGALAYNSPAALAIHGYTAEEMAGRNTFELIHPDDQARCLAFTDAHIHNRPHAHSVQYRYRNKDGSYVWMEATLSNHLDNPHIKGLVVISRDISERKRATEQLELYEKLFRYVSDMVIVADSDGLLKDVNPSFVRTLGYAEDELRNQPLVKFIYPEDWKKTRDELTRQRQGHFDTFDFENRYVCRDGSLRWFAWNAYYEEDTRLFYGIARDVTERKRIESELMAAKEAAEVASRAKSAFLANMSHEIRTPITGILGFAELLEGSELAATQRKYLSVITSSAEALLTLVNDILDLSKIEAGMLKLEHREFSLREALQAVIGNQRPLAEAKRLTLALELPAELPDRLMGDQHRLQQILLNLMGNAVKFTESGHIALAVSIEERQETIALLRFDLSDTGIGISPEEMDDIFKPFSQADSSMSRKFGGTGLGLAICTQLASLMGGEIWADSREGVGSTFHVRLPFMVSSASPQTAAAQVTVPPPRWEGPPLRILLVEDYETSRILFAEMLTPHGHRVEVARNGAEALELCRRADYDMILMDVQMPVMDGIEAISQLRAREALTGGHVPVIALTAHAMEKDQHNLLGKGFDGYVSKPARIRDLLREMQRCLAR